MDIRLVSLRSRPDLDPKGKARLFDLIATGLDRYLRANVDFAVDSRMYADMPSDPPEATRW